MKSSTRLTSAVFQLTPTRTRCDLIVIANDKKEKIASGLLNPFLAHLKTAQDQIAKGGYSIILEPESGRDTSWFTKATLERFVRFVSTPEILERVYTIESEILHIEEAISFQSRNDVEKNTEQKRKSLGGYEGDKSAPNPNEENAIILYTPGDPSPEASGSCSEEGNSKVQLLKVLGTRKTVLQREQEMAFARAVAAGFSIDDMALLVSFAGCFGAMRLKEACSRFMDLWKSKHEKGQWIGIDTSEALAAHSDFSAMNASGVILCTTSNNHDEFNHEMATEDIAKSGSTNGVDNPMANGRQEYIPGQFPNLLFPPWSMNTPPGAPPVFNAYPVQGMPYYQAYTGNGPFFPAHPNSMEHSHSTPGQQSGRQSQSHDDKDNGMSLDSEASHCRKQRKTSRDSNRKQSVVIQNINYITSKEKKLNSDTNSETDTENECFEDDGYDVTHKNNKRSTRNGGSHLKSGDKLNFGNDEATVLGKDSDGRQWQAFQECLLRGGDVDSHADNNDMSIMEKNGKIKRYIASDDPLDLGTRDTAEEQNSRMKDIHRINGNLGRRLKGSEEQLFPSASNDFRESKDPLALDGFEGEASKPYKDSSSGMVDGDLIVPFRSISLGQGTDRGAIDIDSEVPSKYQKLEPGGHKDRVNYEPSDLTFMPERGNDKGSPGYDLTLDYEMQVCAGGSEERGKKAQTNVKNGGLRKSDKDRKSKVASDSLLKQRTGGPMRKGKPSSTLDDARARAEKLRSYKADLQKMKKQQEEAELKRLESLKLARQKRIVARGGSTSTSVKPPVLSPQPKQPLSKFSPVANRGSKFSDSEPGSSSPLQRSKVRTSLGSGEPNKGSKISKLSEGSPAVVTKLKFSPTSLPEPKRKSNSFTPDSKASSSRIRRLSEPKTITKPQVTTTKSRSAEAVLKRKLSAGPDKNKLSAIIDLDRSKAASLPELKIKTPKSHTNTDENRLSVKNKQKVHGTKPSVLPKHAELNVNNSNTTHQIDAEENPIVEKNVLVLESERSHPTSYPSEAKPGGWNQQHNDSNEVGKSDISESAPIRAPSMQTQREPAAFQLQEQSDHNQAPYARVSSLEAPSEQLEPGKAPLLNSVLLEKDEDVRKADVKTLKTEIYKATSEKTPTKDSSKGLRRLLKFGKKNPTSSSVDQSVDSECNGGNGLDLSDNGKKMATTSEVHTLKSLISQNDTSSGSNAPRKTSRHFSLLPSFFTKASEKRQTS